MNDKQDAPPEQIDPARPMTARDQVYVRLVRETSEVSDIAFINPDAFNALHLKQNGTVDPADVETMRRTIDAQLPGRSSHFTDAQIARLVESSIENGPFTRRYEFPEEQAPFAIVNLQGTGLDHRDEYMPLVADRELEVLSDIPGEDVYWDGFWGIHEGTHPNQPVFGEHTSPDESNADVLSRELEADRAGLAWLRAKGQDDMAQALIDFRALSASVDPMHAGIAVLDDTPGTQAGTEVYQAAAKFEGAMDFVVGQDLGLSDADVTEMRLLREEEYAANVNRLLGQGAYDNVDPNPYMREFIEAYAGAVQRQITDRRVARELNPAAHENENIKKAETATIEGGTPVVTLAEGDQATLTIGGVSAPQFFAAKADPALAERTAALALTERPTRETDPTVQTGTPAPR